MNDTRSKLIFGATLFAFALAACAGDDDAPPAGVHAGETESAPSPPPASRPSSGGATPSPSAPSPGRDSGTPAPTRTLALQCQGPAAPTSAVICLETAEGRAGDLVALEVHLLRPAGCGPARYAMGAVQVDPAKFEIANPEEQQDCLKRDQGPSFSDPTLDVISWQAFDESVAPAGCTASAGVGEVDVIEVRIKPGTPPGDYDLPFETSEILGGGPGCSGISLHVAGKIRVLP